MFDGVVQVGAGRGRKRQSSACYSPSPPWASQSSAGRGQGPFYARFRITFPGPDGMGTWVPAAVVPFGERHDQLTLGGNLVELALFGRSDQGEGGCVRVERSGDVVEVAGADF